MHARAGEEDVASHRALRLAVVLRMEVEQERSNLVVAADGLAC